MTDFIQRLIDSLVSAQIDSPRLELRMMIADLLHCDVNEISLNLGLSSEQGSKLKDMVARRVKHEPLDKILGYRDFYKYRFVVNDDVLSPRPDSEVIVEEAIALCKKIKPDSILELGVGSGCLILSVLGDFPELLGVGIDKSEMALKIAAANAENLNLSARVQWKQTNYFSDDLPRENFSIIISNPPYIPHNDIEGLDTEVKKYDPISALDGGTDGYDHYRRLAEIAPDLLKENGYFLLEAGIGQADKIVELFEQHGLVLYKKVRDLSGVERCVIMKK